MRRMGPGTRLVQRWVYCLEDRWRIVGGKFYLSQSSFCCVDRPFYRDSHGWRTAFYITCGIAIIPVIGAFWAVPSHRPEPGADRRIDFFGALLSTAGLVMLLYVFTSGPTASQGFRTPGEQHEHILFVFELA
jgi:hypothetical protein